MTTSPISGCTHGSKLSTGGLFRGREAGLDVMGNGALVPYVGSVQKRVVDAPEGGSAFDAVREALHRSGRRAP